MSRLARENAALREALQDTTKRLCALEGEKQRVAGGENAGENHKHHSQRNPLLSPRSPSWRRIHVVGSGSGQVTTRFDFNPRTAPFALSAATSTAPPTAFGGRAGGAERSGHDLGIQGATTH